MGLRQYSPRIIPWRYTQAQQLAAIAAALHGQVTHNDPMKRGSATVALHEDAAHHLTAAVLRVRALDRAGAVRERLGQNILEDTDMACVVDTAGRFLGIVPFAELFRLPPDTVLGDVMQRCTAVTADEDQEKVASVALQHGLASVPVVDTEGQLLGVVPARALMLILRHEHVEDIHHLAGIRHETSMARRALDAPSLSRVRDRLPWLLLGLLGSILATALMGQFEATLQQHLALAFFIPGLVYLSDAIGTQTEAIVVRGLSLAHVGMGRLLAGELRTGLIIGSLLGGLTLPLVWLTFGDLRLAIAVGGSLVVAGVLATGVGLLLPWLLTRLGRDPAYGSGPLATVVQDVLTLLTYFFIVRYLY